MPRVLAARNRNRANRGRAGLGRLRGHAGPAAAVAAKSFPFSPIEVPPGGTISGQPQWVQDTGRIAADVRRTNQTWRLPPVNGMHLTGQHGRELRVQSCLYFILQTCIRFTRNNGENRACSLSRFSATADYECTKASILRQINDRTRGMKVCR